jgi:hypothetical protein
MKKAIIAAVILVMMVPASFAMKSPQPVIEVKDPKAIRLIEINADVVVVLGQFGNNTAVVEGDDQFMEYITIRHVGSKLVINALKRRNFKDKGVIYISAEHLAEIQINSEAYVQSSGALNVPMLNVMINGACQVMLANTGNLNFVPSNHFDIEYKTRKDLQPITFYKFRKK